MADSVVPDAVVVGTGGIGGLLAGLLARAGADVLCVTTERSALALAERGLRVESSYYGTFAVPMRGETRLESVSPLVFITTKATALDAALGRLPSAMPRVAVVPLLNGVEHVARIRSALAADIVVGTIGRVESYSPEPGRVVHRSTQRPVVELAVGAGCDTVAALLARADVEVNVLPSAADVLWRKLVRVGPVACATAASGLPLGELRHDADLRKAIAEAVEVARAEGAAVPDAADVLAAIDRLPDDLETSLQRDVSRGDTGELDALGGAILRAGKRHRIVAPAMHRLVAAVEARVTPATGRR